MYLRGLWGWRPLKWQTKLRIAVWLQDKVRERMLELRLSLNIGPVGDTQCLQGEYALHG